MRQCLTEAELSLSLSDNQDIPRGMQKELHAYDKRMNLELFRESIVTSVFVVKDVLPSRRTSSLLKLMFLRINGTCNALQNRGYGTKELLLLHT